MAGTGVLIQKEIRQHWLPFSALGTMLGLAAAGTLVTHFFQGQSSSVFTGLRGLLQIALPAAAMVLCGRLVIAEYRAKTQLFLEALPLSRWRMIVVKYLLGLGGLLGFTFGLLTFGWLIFRSHEAMTPRVAGILAARAGASAWFWYSFFFTAGFLGRYRWPILILAVFVGYAVDTATAWNANDFGPFKLLDQEFGTERQNFPTGVLATTAITSGVITLLGFSLALLREGNVSSMLAERMSYREKVLVAAILLCGVSAVGLLEDRREKVPYDLSGAASAQARGVVVKVAGPEEAAQALAEKLANELSALREYLGSGAFPNVLVTHREDLDATKYERGQLAKAEGFVVRANYTAPDFSSSHFLAWLIPEFLDHRSHERTKLEAARWVRDGMGEFWARRAHMTEPISVDRDLALRALHAAPGGITPKDLHEWYKVRERVGEGVAQGLAWSGLKALVLSSGEEGGRRFLQQMYASGVPNDFRATIADWRHPWTERLSESTALSLERFAEAWNRMLAEGRTELQGELATVPRLKLMLQQQAVTDSTTLLKWRLTAEPPLPDEVEYRIRYVRLPGLDEPFQEDDLLEEADRGKLDVPIERELTESFSRGTRAAIGAAVYSPALGCDVISGWQRIDIGP